MTTEITLLDLVDSLNDIVATEAEVIAIVVQLVNSGTVRLCGNFRGHRFDETILFGDEAAQAV